INTKERFYLDFPMTSRSFFTSVSLDPAFSSHLIQDISLAHLDKQLSTLYYNLPSTSMSSIFRKIGGRISFYLRRVRN
ncbi:hypothetical protein ACFLXG_04490, partial [Chloroflexota bacterium]